MATTDVLEDITQAKNILIPPDIDMDEDSGFASNPGTTKNNPDDKLICNDVQFSTIQIDEPSAKKSRPGVPEKREREEEYQRQRQEQAYNGLKHLLKKSKFYATFLRANVNDPKKSPLKSGKRSPPKVLKQKWKGSDNSDEDFEISPPKKPKLTKRQVKKVNTKGKKNLPSTSSRYNTRQRTNKIQSSTKNEMTQNFEDTEEDLNTASDDDEENKEAEQKTVSKYNTRQRSTKIQSSTKNEMAQNFDDKEEDLNTASDDDDKENKEAEQKTASRYNTRQRSNKIQSSTKNKIKANLEDIEERMNTASDCEEENKVHKQNTSSRYNTRQRNGKLKSTVKNGMEQILENNQEEMNTASDSQEDNEKDEEKTASVDNARQNTNKARSSNRNRKKLKVEDIEEVLNTASDSEGENNEDERKISPAHNTREKKELKMNLKNIEEEFKKAADNEEEVQEDEQKEFQPPKYLTGKLHPYQEVGLDWLRALHKNGLNGILADEMGLGKTIQAIALICWLMEMRVDGPYLVIAPLSTTPNWMAEFERFAPSLPVYLLHGSPEAREAVAKKMNTKKSVNGFRTYPIILTTYQVVLKDASLLRRYTWRYIIVDEGQRMKNFNSQLARVLRSIHSVHRLILTGTPLQNDLDELWALLNFLQPDIFNDLDIFQSWFDVREMQYEKGAQKILEQERQKNIVSMLREILSPFMLRRVKEEVALDLPNKKEMIVYAPITELQRELYTAILNYDTDMLSMKVPQSDVIDTLPDGTRPRRACTLRNKFSSIYFDPYDLNNIDLDTGTLKNVDVLNDQKLTIGVKTHLSTWNRYTDINERNKDYFIRLNFSGVRFPQYRKIVDHPYLVHWPKAPDGFLQVDENLVKASGKLLVLDAMLHKLHAKGHKVLIFSTLVMLLDLLEDYLTLRPWKYVTLSGRTPIHERDESIRAFNTDPNLFLFLISTRAGGLGLNLAAADTVIIYDSDWNPQVDLQAMARCHRIGQTRPVVVYKLCTKGTIDEEVMNRAQAKRNLEKMVISKELKTNGGLTANFIEELQRLFKSSNDIVITSKKEVYSDAELEKILDRSDLYQANSK